MRGRKPNVLALNLPKIAVPPAPKHFSLELRRQWRAVVRDMIDRRIFAPSMSALVESYISSVWMVGLCRTQIDKDGDVPALDGAPARLHPAAAMMSKHIAIVARLGAELGLTPASRSRKAMQSDHEDDDDDAAAMGL